MSHKKILLAITGGIAAYKCAELVRRLKDHQHDVKVVMTQSAHAFITPLTLQAVSGNPVSDSLLDPSAEAAMGHIEFAKWADLILVAPATANTIAKMASGLADDLLSTLLLATPSPVAIAPAMNQQMWAHSATQANLLTLKQRGISIWGPASGEQACGDIGSGRMLEPNELVELCNQALSNEEKQPLILAGKTVTITAGPTREALDPVRFISNHSSGKMGYALANAALQLGAKVNLISGPVSIQPPSNAKLFHVESALEMHQSALKLATESDIFIGCAAVADYRSADLQTQKIKKQGDEMTLTLVKNPDIIADVAGLSHSRPFTVGFAAETQNVADYARKKLINKKLDMICANDVSNQAIGFNSDHNALTVFWSNGQQDLGLHSKEALSLSIMNLISSRLKG
ncbi:phosphopantothenoylcysteine decarboxylase / phosphopantothenate--cysteine ligase [Pseudoalteromonas ulvae UL12]|uniref:Coenzyme A biosynthesis bifunctional protein CoaBC n=1 Tax=Pseudoalteromonas ulvae TaxID=107327 RepID=A0A244CPG5_PSEDV|nr:bifunctional phosphopantothenoylcysteine decarboxylase/phosphopantothenate--cysteine ligase CoaBC [Pseudoalteromonas ulvae]MBE0363074.1 phosphopantothenoylcysteine decarboxylase / phosphopantothenate--cysteine ligase [Pseudoalteromonas ulvae UL12]OUL57109.1 bifunctional 4'-phosphopantothenoylcysteine decarboxylase/phosphopantothenoylcysteine synthetase [Pseudoalteromonas ulvae]